VIDDTRLVEAGEAHPIDRDVAKRPVGLAQGIYRPPRPGSSPRRRCACQRRSSVRKAESA
jgi:hypothetical protein